MKKILLLLFAGTLLCSCSQYGRLLKSKDHHEQYVAAKNYIAAGKYEKARTLFDKLVIPFMNSPQADSVLFYQGYAYYMQRNYGASGEVFDGFRSRYQRSPLLEQAEYLYAMGYYLSSPEPVRDQTITYSAIDAIDTYLSRYPTSKHLEDLELKRVELIEKLHDKAYLNAYTYYKIRLHKSAISALRSALKEYPDSKHREDMLYLIARSSYDYAFNSVPEVQRERYLDMMERYLNYIAEYPEGPHAAELKKLYERAQKFTKDENNDNGTTEKK